jgi:O-antigen/teichoic acid export membrane protein
MGKARNAFYSNTFFIFAMRFFPSLAGVLAVSLYSRLLPKPVYGQYAYFWLLLNVMYPIACFGLHVLILNYPPAIIQQHFSQMARRFRVGYLLWIVAMGLVFAALQRLATGIPLYLSLFFFVAYATGFIAESLLIASSRFRLLVITNSLYAVFYVLIHLMQLRTANFSVVAVFAGLVVVVIARTLVYCAAALRSISKLSSTNSATAVLPAQAKALWLHLGLYDIIQTSSLWVDKLFVAVLFTPAVFANYLNGAMNIPFLPLLLSAVGSAVLLQLATTGQTDAKKNAPALLCKSGRLLSCVVFPVFFFLLVFNTEVVRLLYSARYDEAIPVFTISLLVLPVRAYNFTSILQQQHKGSTINKGAIGEVVIALLLMYPLYLVMGIKGLAFSFVLSTYLQAIYYLHASAKMLEVSMLRLIPLVNWTIKFIAVGLLFTGLRLLVTNHLSGRMPLYAGLLFMAVLVSTLLYAEHRKELAE